MVGVDVESVVVVARRSRAWSRSGKMVGVDVESVVVLARRSRA
jgi:hypothetical protein